MDNSGNWTSESNLITPTMIDIYRLLKQTSIPLTIDEIVNRLGQSGINISEWTFRTHVRPLIQVGAVQAWGDCYRLLDSGGLLCRKIEELTAAPK